jgi:hypothetical protein
VVFPSFAVRTQELEVQAEELERLQEGRLLMTGPRPPEAVREPDPRDSRQDGQIHERGQLILLADAVVEAGEQDHDEHRQHQRDQGGDQRVAQRPG